MKPSKQVSIASLEDRLDLLVHKLRNAPPEEQDQYKPQIAVLVQAYHKAAGRAYVWKERRTTAINDIDYIRRANDGGAVA